MRFIKFLSLLVLFISTDLQAHKIKIWQDCGNPRMERINSSITVFPADHQTNSGYAVVICPGGSYRYLGIKHEGYEVAELLSKSGITAFVLKYRTGMKGHHHPAMIEDLQRAIQIVKESASQYGIDPHKVGVMGFSAGGHLAGTSAIYHSEDYLSPLGIEHSASLKPAFAVMVYPVVTMKGDIAHKKSRKNLIGDLKRYDLIEKLSLEQNLHDHIPPLFIVHAEDDNVVNVRNSDNFVEQLKLRMIPHLFLRYKTGGHGFGLKPKKGGAIGEWSSVFINWIMTDSFAQ